MSGTTKLMRQAIKQVLDDGVPTPKYWQTFTSRAEAVGLEPGDRVIVVTNVSETASGNDGDFSLDTSAPRRYRKTATIGVEVLIYQADDLSLPYDDELDDILGSAETLLLDEALIRRTFVAKGGEEHGFEDFVWQDTEYDYDARGMRLFGDARLLFSMSYYQDATETFAAPGLGDLDTVHVDGDLPGVGEGSGPGSGTEDWQDDITP